MPQELSSESTNVTSSKCLNTLIHPPNSSVLKKLSAIKMFSSSRKRNPSYSPTQKRKQPEEPPPWLATSLKPENFIPGIVIGFLLGLFFDFSSSRRGPTAPAPFKGSRRSFPGKSQSIASDSNHRGGDGGSGSEEELKMVLVVRQDLRMGVGKIASQCAHAATGMYSDLLQSHRFLLRQWEQYGQAKIVLSCKNQQEMNRLKEAAERCGLRTFIVADAGRTQVQSGSRTVLAIGPGNKAAIDSVTGKLRLL